MSGFLADGTVRLEDGRSLAYSEWGRSDGPVVLFFHGSPGSRLWCPNEEHTVAAGVRLLTVDRPGYGGSDPRPGRLVGEWATDLAELSGLLEIDCFGVIGMSGGGPYAMAAAALLPDRVTGTCVSGSDAANYILEDRALDDQDRERLTMIDGFGVAGATDELAARRHEWARALAEQPLAGIDDLLAADPWMLDTPEIGMFEASIREALRHGAIGAAADWVALRAPWGFSADGITGPISIWHGAQDPEIDEGEVRRLAARVPGAVLTIWPEVGHFGAAKHFDSLLAAALGNPRSI